MDIDNLMCAIGGFAAGVAGFSAYYAGIKSAKNTSITDDLGQPSDGLPRVHFVKMADGCHYFVVKQSRIRFGPGANSRMFNCYEEWVPVEDDQGVIRFDTMHDADSYRQQLAEKKVVQDSHIKIIR